MIKAAHGSVNSGMFNLLKAMSRLRAFVRPRSFRARRPRLTVEYFSVQRKEREKEREREREREEGGVKIKSTLRLIGISQRDFCAIGAIHRGLQIPVYIIQSEISDLHNSANDAGLRDEIPKVPL